MWKRVSYILVPSQGQGEMGVTPTFKQKLPAIAFRKQGPPFPIQGTYSCYCPDLREANISRNPKSQPQPGMYVMVRFTQNSNTGHTL